MDKMYQINERSLRKMTQIGLKKSISKQEKEIMIPDSIIRLVLSKDFNVNFDFFFSLLKILSGKKKCILCIKSDKRKSYRKNRKINVNSNIAFFL